MTGTQTGYTTEGAFPDIPLVRVVGQPRPERKGAAYGEVWFKDVLEAEITFRVGSDAVWAGPAGWIWLDGDDWEALLVAKQVPGGIDRNRWTLSHAFMGGIQGKA